MIERNDALARPDTPALAITFLTDIALAEPRNLTEFLIARHEWSTWQHSATLLGCPPAVALELFRGARNALVCQRRLMNYHAHNPHGSTLDNPPPVQ